MTDLERIESVTRAAEAADGTAPLDEATWLALRNHPDSVRTWDERDGFALLVGSDLSLVVAPEAQLQGISPADALREVLAMVPVPTAAGQA